MPNCSAQGMHTKLMTGCGTLYWMAPEMIKGDKYNQSVDVYAYGMCLYEMVTGTIPWKNVSAQEIPFRCGVGRGHEPSLPVLTVDQNARAVAT